MPTPNRSALLDHLRSRSLRTDGPFTLASGASADWYLDARQTTFSGGGGLLVGAAIHEVLSPGVQAVGGMTMGADPIAFAVAFTSDGAVDAFSVRKEAKGHGTGGRLVGPVVGAGTRVAILEDTTTTGAAFLAAVDVAAGAGLEVVQAIALFDRSGDTVEGAMNERSLPYVALAVPSDLGVDA